MIPMVEPRGLSLQAQAQALVRAGQVREFGPAAATPRPAVFPMMDVLHAINRGELAQRAAATVALQQFMSAPSRMHRQFRGALREMVTAGDFPAGATLQAYIDRFLITGAEMDTGYEEIFQMHDVATSEAQLRRDGFKVLDVKSGLTFRKRLPGEPVQFQSVSGSDVFVPYDMYGGGIAMDRVWWDDQDYLLLSDAFQIFRDQAFGSRASAFYGLLTTLPTSINYTTGADLAAKLNGACATILRKVFGKGYQANARTEFVLLYAPERAGEVDAALAITTDIAQQTAPGKQKVQYRFKRVPSTFVPSADYTSGGTTFRAGIYVILPKRKLKGGVRMDLTLFGQFNVAAYADDIAGFQRYAGIVGDNDQVARIP